MSYYPRWFKLTLVLSAAFLLAGLYAYYRIQCRQVLSEIQESLGTIHQHKMETVVQWRAVRLDKPSIELIGQYNFPILERWIQNSPGSEEIDALKLSLEATRLQYQYNDVIYLNPSGKIYFRLNAQAVDIPKKSREAFADSLRKREAVLTDIYADPETGMPQIDQVLPFYTQGGDFLGAIIYQYRGDQLLETYFPLPTLPPGRSVETYLVHSVGDSVLFLSGLRHRKDAALNFSIPSDRVDALVVKAVKSRGELVRGKDYRGLNAIAVVGVVPDTRWFLITQIEEREAFASPRRDSLIMLGALLLLFVSVVPLLAIMKFRKRDEFLSSGTSSELTVKPSYETVLDGITEGCQIIDFEWRFIYGNAIAARQLGCLKNELPKHTVMELFPVSENRDLFAAFRYCMNERKAQYMEYELKKPDGTMGWYSFSIQPVPEGIFILSRDISDRKKVKAEKQRFVTAVEQSGELVIMSDAKGYVRYVNPAFEAVTGFKKEEVLGQLPPKIIHDSQDEVFYRKFWDTIHSGKPWQGIYINQKKDGSHYREKISIQPIFDQSGKIDSYIAVGRDLTVFRELKAEKDKLQEQLFQVQKMESIGRLAGGVAHDFNNMLNVIQGHAQLSLHDMEPEHPLFSSLQAINNAAERSAELTNQLLAFARKQAVAPKVIHLNDTVNGLLKMLRRLIGERIHLAWIPGYDIWQIKMDPSQIHQILTNLAVNARDAMDTAGRITIETANFTMDEAYCEKNTLCVPGDYIMLSVSDDGCGMDKETRAHIFEPFYTTKGLGKGTGLGLSTVYGIIKQNHGFLNVYSEPGFGTTFKIYIPRYHGEEETSEDGTGMDEIPALAVGISGKTILLVEDEVEVMDVTRMMLERLGLKVLAAATPGEALSIVEKHDDEIDLMIVDVVMPEMTGRELSEQLLLLRPELKILYMSGYTADVIANHGILDRDVNFIQKPLSVKTLVLKIHEILGKS